MLIAVAGVALTTSFAAPVVATEPVTQVAAAADLPAGIDQVVHDVQEGLTQDDDDMHW
jgi:hypothetical protein